MYRRKLSHVQETVPAHPDTMTREEEDQQANFPPAVSALDVIAPYVVCRSTEEEDILFDCRFQTFPNDGVVCRTTAMLLLLLPPLCHSARLVCNHLPYVGYGFSSCLSLIKTAAPTQLRATFTNQYADD